MVKTVAIGIPHQRDLTPEFIQSMFSVLQDSQRYTIYLYEGTLISVSRNKIAMGFKEDYLMFIDSDIKFPIDGIKRLLAHNKDIVAGVYNIKREPYAPTVFFFGKTKPEPVNQIPSELFQADAVAAGFLLIRKNVLFDMLDPKFVKRWGLPFNMWQRSNGEEYGEDLGFCMRAKKLGYEIWVDPTIPLSHIKDGVEVQWTGKN